MHILMTLFVQLDPNDMPPLSGPRVIVTTNKGNKCYNQVFQIKKFRQSVGTGKTQDKPLGRRTNLQHCVYLLSLDAFCTLMQVHLCSSIQYTFICCNLCKYINLVLHIICFDFSFQFQIVLFVAAVGHESITQDHSGVIQSASHLLKACSKGNRTEISLIGIECRV